MGNIFIKMELKFSGFDWDGGNREKNLEKHGVTNQEAERIFFGEPLVYADTIHSTAKEERYVCFGEMAGGRFLFVAFTLRGMMVRIISARPMSQKERNWYAEEKKKNSH